MSVNLKAQSNTLIAKIEGEVDHHTCENVRIKIDDAVINRSISKIILDMTGITFMDSSGIGLVMGRYKMISKLNGNLVIVSRNEYINKILKMASVFKYVECFEDEKSALIALNRGRN